MKSQLSKLNKSAPVIGVAALLLLGWAGTVRTHAADHQDSNAKGLSDSKALLTEFENIYWRWAPGFGDGNVTLPTDQNGNAVYAGVALMPLPNAPGDGTPGSIGVTLNAKQPFFLPLIDLLGTSYTDGSPADALVDRMVFGPKNLRLKFQIDGKTILTQEDALDYYTGFYFDPPIPFNQFGIDSIIYSQGIGALHTPLSPGKHVLKLDVTLPVPAYGITIEYHNTFNVTVQPKGH